MESREHKGKEREEHGMGKAAGWKVWDVGQEEPAGFYNCVDIRRMQRKESNVALRS